MLSLNPQVDRLCMVCEMQISAKGKLIDYRFYEAVMNSHARLTYTKVAKNEGDEELRARYSTLVPHLEDLYKTLSSLLGARHQRGAIDLKPLKLSLFSNAMGRN